MKVFLFHKYIPGFASEYPAETYIAPDWLPVAGHMFDPDCSLDTLLTDMRSYILTRPLHAVTKVKSSPPSLRPTTLIALTHRTRQR
jgi:hypothetical protein